MASRAAVYETAKLLVLLSASWLVPIRQLWPLARLLRLGRRRGAERSPGTAALVLAHLVADQVTVDQGFALYRRWQDRWLDLTLHVLALKRPLRRWRPVVRFTGRPHLEAALARGTGAVLWLSDFIYSPIILPRTLAEAGFPLTLLSRPEHGFSVLRFGMRWLNPLWQQVENRWLAERVVIENNDAKPCLARLRRALALNGVVAVAAVETARRTVDAPFLTGRLRLATGPLHLALTAGAPVLPATAIRRRNGSYDVVIEPPLDLGDAAAPRYEAAACAYAQGLEYWVRRYPDQWNGWIALGRMVETVPGFAESFACAAALDRDLAAAPRASG
jgi:lauroyl/myristoyl acyltransferase